MTDDDLIPTGHPHWGMLKRTREMIEEEFRSTLPRGHAYIESIEFPRIARGELIDEEA